MIIANQSHHSHPRPDKPPAASSAGMASGRQGVLTVSPGMHWGYPQELTVQWSGLPADPRRCMVNVPIHFGNHRKTLEHIRTKIASASIWKCHTCCMVMILREREWFHGSCMCHSTQKTCQSNQSLLPFIFQKLKGSIQSWWVLCSTLPTALKTLGKNHQDDWSFSFCARAIST